jgi:hypothetical protein
MNLVNKIITFNLTILLVVFQLSCSKEATPTCDDGIMNGSEIEVDCGGATCPACITCNDGIMNGDEIGIDCGGTDCQPCPSDEELVIGVWQQLTHTEGSLDHRKEYKVDDVFYEFKANLDFKGLSVTYNQTGKSLFTGDYLIEPSVGEITRKIKNQNLFFRYELTETTLKLINTGTTGQDEIQTFIKIEEDLCLDSNCQVNTCHFGYCVL